VEALLCVRQPQVRTPQDPRLYRFPARTAFEDPGIQVGCCPLNDRGYPRPALTPTGHPSLSAYREAYILSRVVHGRGDVDGYVGRLLYTYEV
jgi:hypothetical protein